jgi:hypothetical protein
MVSSSSTTSQPSSKAKSPPETPHALDSAADDQLLLDANDPAELLSDADLAELDNLDETSCSGPLPLKDELDNVDET